MCDLLFVCHFAVVVECVLHNFIHLAVFAFYRNRAVHDFRVVSVDGHAARVASFGCRCLVEMAAAVCQECLCPVCAVPFCIVVIVRVLAVVDFYHSYRRIAVLVERNVPQPVAPVGCSVHYCCWIGVGERLRLAHLERAVVHIRQHLAVDVFHLPAVDVECVEIQPVRIFVVWVSRSVAHVYLVLAVGDVFCIRACTG